MVITRASMNKQLNAKMNDFFLGQSLNEVTTDDIDYFMKEINPLLLEFSHIKIEEYTFSGHIDRFSLKESLRLYILQQLARRFPSQVVEFLWRLELKEAGK